MGTINVALPLANSRENAPAAPEGQNVTTTALPLTGKSVEEPTAKTPPVPSITTPPETATSLSAGATPSTLRRLTENPALCSVDSDAWGGAQDSALVTAKDEVGVGDVEGASSGLINGDGVAEGFSDAEGDVD